MYFVHPSTDISVGISVDMYINQHSTNVLVNISAECQLICRSTYRSSVGRYVDRDVSVDVSTDVSTEISTDISVDIAANTRPICWPLIVGGISVDCWWYFGQKLRLLVVSVEVMRISSFFGQPQNFLKASCSAFMWRKCSRYQARHSSEILPNTQNTVDRKEDMDDEG